MTPTRIPRLCADVPDAPANPTRTYFDDGTSFGAPKAEPRTDVESDMRGELAVVHARVAELEVRLLEMTALARSSSQRALDAVDRALAAEARATSAEARLDLVMTARTGAALDRAFDAACRSVAGRSHAEVAAILNQQVADPDGDEDTVVVDPADLEITVRSRPGRSATPTDDDLDRIALAIRRVRAQRGPAALVQLADLVEELLRCERSVHVAQRQPRGDVPYQLLEALDDAQVALSKAVRR